MRSATIAALIGAAALASPAIADHVEIIDGDTIRLGGRVIRLWGIDAPEGRQSCMVEGHWWRPGPEAAEALRAIIGHGKLACDSHGRDRYGRTVAVCMAGGHDIGEAMVRAGWAFDYYRYSLGAYAAVEAEAKAAHRGIWRGTCSPPWEWRRATRR